MNFVRMLKEIYTSQATVLKFGDLLAGIPAIFHVKNIEKIGSLGKITEAL